MAGVGRTKDFGFLTAVILISVQSGTVHNGKGFGCLFLEGSVLRVIFGGIMMYIHHEDHAEREIGWILEDKESVAGLPFGGVSSPNEISRQ